MNELTKALKDAVSKGTQFTLRQVDESTVIFSVTGGVSDIKIRLPFIELGVDRTGDLIGADYQAFSWDSSLRTAGTLISAVEALPEDASPIIVLDTEEWDGGGLILKGTLTKKGRGRSKEVQEQHINLLFDAGVRQ